MGDIPIWQVHRGYWMGGLRENTMQAFYAAKRLGAQMIELDVRISIDGVPVIYHDESLERIYHIKRKVGWMKWSELGSLNIFKLEDVLKSENVPKYINVELKSEGLFPWRLVRNVAKVLKNYKKKRYLISSFNPICLWFSEKYLPGYPRALIIHDSEMVMSPRLERYVKIGKPHYLNVEQKLLMNEESRNRLLACKLPICVWTVNDFEQAQFFIDRGAVSIISDQPPPAQFRHSGRD